MSNLELVSDLPYFSVQSLASLLETSSQVARTTLSRWENQDKVVRLKRGVYVSRQFVLKNQHRSDFYNLIANIIQPFSYLSLEYILQLTGILTTGTYPVTAVTTKNTNTISNALGTFRYQHIKQELYTGYQTSKIQNIRCYRANKAKALFDFLYLKPLPRSKQVKSYDLAEDLRLNLNNFTDSEVNQFAHYVELAQSAKMNFIINNLRADIWQDF
jgi:predicted transcriptional regulator of viral defense system